MKSNYKFRTLLLSAIVAVSSVTGYSETIITTTVFSDDFTRTDVSPGGTPEIAYTVTKTGTATPIIENGNILRLPNVNGENARTTITASATSFLAPFNTVIESINADSIVWTFNIRQNYNGRLTGIDDAASRGIAAVLLASSSDFSTANGYAIINGAATPINYRLVKFSGGLTNAANIADIQLGQTLSDNRSYMSIKVVFITASKTWKLYDRLDAGAFANPTDETTPYTFAGAVVDNTYTGVALNTFGFTHKYSAATAFNFWVDNYKVTAYKTTVTTAISNANADNLLVYVQGGRLVVRGASGTVSVYNTLGQKLYEQPAGAAINRNLDAGLYIVKVNGQTVKAIVK
jgi:hypothetical protein